jgi:hypothetical protein
MGKKEQTACTRFAGRLRIFAADRRSLLVANFPRGGWLQGKPDLN